jgi:hypothetical protein
MASGTIDLRIQTSVELLGLQKVAGLVRNRREISVKYYVGRKHLYQSIQADTLVIN